MMRTDDVALMAEKAMLGGLLLDPAPFPVVNGWVRGQDFSDGWNRTAWALMREAHAAGTSLSATELGAKLMERLGPAKAQLVRVHDLLSAVGRNPDARPAARVMVDAGVRREIAGQGVLIEAASLEAALSHEGRPLRAALRIAGAGYLVAGERWADAHGQTTEHLADLLPAQLRAGAADLELRRAADKFLGDYPGPGREEVRLHEQRLIACLATHPTAIGPTSDWLRPDRITNREWATVYAALVQMSDAGQWIDPVTLAMTTVRLSASSNAAPSLTRLIDAIEQERSSVPGYLRQVVAGDHLRLLAATGADTLRRQAAAPETDVADLLSTATTLVQTLSHLGSVLPDRLDIGPGRSSWGRGVDPPAAGTQHEGPVAG